MNTDRLGVITFFGILVPGAYLMGVLALAFASILELLNLHGHERAVSFLSKNIGLSAAVFLFVSYLMGVLVRLFAPRYVDSLSTWYLIHIRRKKDSWVSDIFPYKCSLSVRLKKDGMGEVLEIMHRLNPSFGMNNNTVFFNYCKWFIEAAEPALSKQINDTEALVRFLSGTTLVLMLALPISISLAAAFTFTHAVLYEAFYFGLLASTIICLILILERFKFQRRREVILVWTCVYMIIKKGILSSVSSNAERCLETIFFTNEMQNINKANSAGPKGLAADSQS